MASPWSPTSRAAARTPSSPTGSSLWNTSNTAAPRARSPTAVTVQASSSSCPSNSSERSSTSNFPGRDRDGTQHLRRRHLLPAAGPRRPRGRSRAGRGHRQRGGAASPRLARGARRPRRRRSRRDGTGLHALHGAAVRLRARKQHRRHRPRPAGLPAAQTRRAQRCVLPVTVQPHHGLQGHAHDNAAAPILSGPARRTLHECDRDRAQPVLHQHVPVLAAGPSVPLRRAQR